MKRKKKIFKLTESQYKRLLRETEGAGVKAQLPMTSSNSVDTGEAKKQAGELPKGSEFVTPTSSFSGDSTSTNITSERYIRTESELIEAIRRCIWENRHLLNKRRRKY